jgi:predicted signal transduction protein with EAL and GGDEF domain
MTTTRQATHTGRSSPRPDRDLRRGATEQHQEGDAQGMPALWVTGRSAGIRPAREVTEAAVMTDPAKAAQYCGTCAPWSVRLHRRFGAGHTSLSQMATVPVHALKIDRHFVADVLDNQVHRAVVRNVVQLARDLRIVMVVEGSSRARCGCDEIQGYMLTPPLPPEWLIEWVSAWRGIALFRADAEVALTSNPP